MTMCNNNFNNRGKIADLSVIYTGCDVELCSGQVVKNGMTLKEILILLANDCFIPEPVNWGDIQGSIVNQEDLNNILVNIIEDVDNKVDEILGKSLVDDNLIIKLENSFTNEEIEIFLSSKVDAEEGKSLISEDLIIKITNSYTNEEIDDKLNLKVDKVDGKSLVDDVEILKLQGLKNQSQLDQQINNAAAQSSGIPIEITGTVLPQGTNVPAVITVKGMANLYGNTAGTTYTQTGGASIVVSANKFKVGYYDRATNLWSAPNVEYNIPAGKEIADWTAKAYNLGDQVFYLNKIYQANQSIISTDVPSVSSKWTFKTGANISNAIIKNGVDAASQGSIYTELYGGDKLQFGLNLSEYSANLSSGIVTVVFTEKFDVDTKIMRINCYAFAAGTIAVKTFRTNGLVATPLSEHEITLVAGINSIDVSNLNIIIPSGGQYGYSANNTTRLGRIGYKANDTRANYHATNVEPTNAFTMNAKATVGGLGFDIYYSFKGVTDGFKVLKSRGNIVEKFIPQLGGLTPDYTTIPGSLRLQFTTGNQSVIANNAVTASKLLNVKLVGRVVTGVSATLVVGIFSSSNNPPITNFIAIDNTQKTIEFTLNSSIGNVSIGILASGNSGQLVEISSFEIYEIDTLSSISSTIDLLETSSNISPQSFGLETAFFSINKIEKKRTSIFVEGDSLMANSTGGTVPNLEPLTQRPIRLNNTNTISRRLYDYLSWNKPNWRRFDDSAWIKTGTWSTSNVEVFEPNSEVYHTSSVAGSYAELIVPIGFENFSFICRMGKLSGTLEVYLNGAIHTTLNTLKDTAGHTGNPVKTIDVFGMPTGQANTIRIVNKSDNTNPIYVWGGFYWSGNTLVVYNVAHGGHTLEQLLTNHIDDELVDNKPDAILFQHTLMNDTARITDAGNTLTRSKAALTTIMDEKIKGKDMIMMSCQPYGKVPSTPSTNFYVNFPGMETVKDSLKSIVYQKKVAYIDVFDIFKKMIINKGSTLESGDGGLWYTHDGQHQNELGMQMYWNMLQPFFKKLTIKD